LEDQELLFEIAKSHKDNVISKEAVRKLTNQGMLEAIATSGIYEVSDIAIMRLTDENVLTCLAKKGNKEAILRMRSNQELLVELARDGYIAAVEVLDKEVLRRIKPSLPHKVREPDTRRYTA